MSKTLEEWIELYNKKTSEKYEPNENFSLAFIPEKGFCELSCANNTILINAVSGDGKFWKEFAEGLARKLNKKYCQTYCIRKAVTAYIRLFGFKIIGTEENNGMKFILGKDKSGNIGYMNECIFENGNHGFIVRWKVPKVITNEI